MTNNELTKIVESIEILQDQEQEIKEFLKERFEDAKQKGFDAAIIRKLIKAKKNLEKSKEEMATLRCYAEAIQLNLF